MKIGSAVKVALTTATLAHVAPYALTLAAYAPKQASFVTRRLPHMYGLGRPGHLALTFDDGPDKHGTPALLNALDTQNWKATFFMLGENVRRHPSIVRDVVSRGHEVQTHGYAHGSYLKMPLPAALDDMRRGRETLEDVTGLAVTRFRPPFGTLSASAMVAARILRLQITLWTAWGMDWEAQATPARIDQRIRLGLLDGGTLLLHDSDCLCATGSWRHTLATIPLLTETLQEHQLQVGPLTQHFEVCADGRIKGG
jgi:peptidoglycan-N-acetylglucosamine deacetylase